ncbi:hypothetical protein PQJ75_19230 [Rhodoplanes sp. TEM]|uniref:Uncharacterized protein n=1 Tax=Rhodoplanes tepidamans TaxID=200616 RepID=A0ABT5JJ13_RHOTP|nr:MULTISPECIES: hypothetical protein [Rhodoplanes]MDC7789720.1 hypothetical protein [Rhodoplanes tepidamans]MDC7985869.1 hypothetical protein [Rhodoplanes sp. TEM]MDQ0354397.1 anti-sigma factor RsiW [Rhodoplanes tepidamans]
MANQEDELLALAATLQRALAELAQVPADNVATARGLAQIERWTLRWIELVEDLLRSHRAAGRARELRAALVELRAASARVHATDGLPFADRPGHAGPRLSEL